MNDNAEIESKCRVLLTGSEGFVGRAIRGRLPADRFHVTGVDLTGSEHTRQCDLRDPLALSLLDDVEVDVVIHTAVDQTSDTIYDNNAASTRNLLRWAAGQRHLKGLIFMSGLLVSTPADIQYTRSKLLGENALTELEVPWVVLRPDAIYGPGEAKIVEYRNLINKGFVPVIGNGKYLRSPTHIWDLVDLMIEIMDRDLFHNKVYEFGAPQPISQKNMLLKLADAMGKRCRVVYLPTFIANILFKIKGGLDLEQIATLHHDRVADLSRLYADFELKPRSFDEGVKTLV